MLRYLTAGESHGIGLTVIIEGLPAGLPLTEEYIAREGHLPDIPSAQDVREHGLNLGQFQMKLLEKIEELTLHVLRERAERSEQRERIEALESRIEELTGSGPLD